jgi:hypothetical protein
MPTILNMQFVLSKALQEAAALPLLNNNNIRFTCAKPHCTRENTRGTYA